MSQATNPIEESVKAVLARLDEEARTRIDANALRRSVDLMGAPLGGDDELRLLLAAKYLAAADGLSGAELAGLRAIMQRLELPEEAQRLVLALNVTQVRPEHVGELVPPRTRPALYLLSGVAVLAALDGLSEEEEVRARQVGEHLGVSPPLVDVVLAEARLTAAALQRGDEAALAALYPLRRAICRLL